jgi:nucleoside-diphosphate-sugar epimerase
MDHTYLVTGGAGFIGSNIVHELVEKGKKVRVIDNLSTGNIKNLKELISEIEFVEGDICDLPAVEKVMKGIDFVFHQAALPSVPRSINDPLASNENNVTGTLNILLAARDNRVKRVIFAGSSSAYGDNPILPKKEDMIPSPLSPYALTKLAGEYYCRIFSDVYGLETITLRYFNVFGPRQNPKSQYAAVIPKFIESLLFENTPVIYGDGEQTRDFTFIKNVVSANILATEAQKTQGEVVNIATFSRISLNQLLKELMEITGKEIKPQYDPPRKGDVKHSLADISRAKELLGYIPEIDLKEGLKRTVTWMQENHKI